MSSLFLFTSQSTGQAESAVVRGLGSLFFSPYPNHPPSYLQADDLSTLLHAPTTSYLVTVWHVYTQLHTLDSPI